MDIDRKMILQTFLAETLEHVGQMEESLVGLELQPDDDEAIQNIFRGAHTLKGNSSSLGFPRIAEVAHALEDVLQRFRDKTISVTGDLITLMLQAVDALGQMISNAVALDETGADPEELTPQQSEILMRLKSSKLVALDMTHKTDPLYGDPRRQRPFGRRPEDAKAWIDSSKTLRVNIEKLDRMLNLAGEITIGRGRLSQMMEEEGRTKEELLEAHRQGDMRFADLQELVMKIRMVPIGPMFRQYIRAVRDVARTSQKIARLSIEGANVEVDNTVIEHLKDPLTHMIRNAMDHGIEIPSKRKEVGKDPCGNITLRAFHEAGSVVIQVKDDGEGLNRKKILEKAISHGMISDGRKLSDEEVYRFIFEPGFSTAEKVTELSGRGVGMDVVRRNIEALRGSVVVESHEGKGTTITIRLPLTLAIIDGFGVGIGEETYVIPLETVIECLEIPEDSRERQNSQGVINLRGKPLPCLRMREFFDLKGNPPKRENIIVVHQGNKQVGLVVDSLYGENQAVIKPLGKMFQNIRAVSGSTILGNGRVALILDVPAILREAMGRPEAGIASETAVAANFP